MEKMAHELLVPNPLLNVIGMFGVIIVFFLIYQFVPNPVITKKRQARFSILDPEVVIVGGGVTGVSLAASLGKHGRRVVVLEDYKSEPNTFRGEWLLPGEVQALEDMGLKDVLQAYQGMPLAGMVFVDHQSDIKTQVTFPFQGKTSRYVNLVQALRKFAESHHTVKFIEGIGTDLLTENERVTGMKYRVKDASDLKVIRAPLTVLIGSCHGYYSNLRGEFTGIEKQTLESYVVGLELNNVQQLHDTYAEIICGLPFAQVVLYKLDEDISRLLLVLSDDPPTNIGSFLENKVAPSLPAHIQKPMLEALKHSRIPTCIPCKHQAATFDYIPGALLLGGTLGATDPTVTLKDVKFWQETLSELPNLADEHILMKQNEFYKKRRKNYTWAINVIARVFITLTTESHSSSVRLRQALFKNIKALEKDVPAERKEAAYSLFALLNNDIGLLRIFLYKTCADAVLQCILSNSWLTPWATVKEAYGIVSKVWKIMSVDT